MKIKNYTSTATLPPQHILNSLFYDAGNTVIWKVAKSRAIKAGDEARNKSKYGYYRVQIDGKQRFVHRVLYKMRTGEEPDIIDHIDGDVTNNMQSNLRASCRQTNGMNRGAPKNSTTGIKNVQKCKRTGKFYAVVKVLKKSFYSSKYEKIEDAAMEAVRLRNIHHGEFARAALKGDSNDKG